MINQPNAGTCFLPPDPIPRCSSDPQNLLIFRQHQKSQVCFNNIFLHFIVALTRCKVLDQELGRLRKGAGIPQLG